MATATAGTGLDAARMEQLRQQFQREQQEAAYMERLKKEQAGGSGIGRLAQGMRGVGSKLASTPVMQGAAAGVTYGATRAATGLFGKIFGFFGEIISSWEPYDIFVKIAALVYLIDIGIGFNPAITIPMHLIFAWVMFFVIGILDRKNLNLSPWTYVWVSVLFWYMFQVINNGVGFLTRVSVATLPFALALAFYFGMVPRFSSKVPMPLFGIPIVAALDVFVLNIFRQRIIDLTGNFSILAGTLAFALGRLVNPLMVIYGAGFMYQESRVAKKVFTILFIIYLTAALWGAFGQAAKLKGASSLTPEEISQGANVLQRSAQSIANLLTLKFINPSVAYAYEKAEQTFGFGQPKEQPKLGLALVQDNTMLKKYDISYKKPEPSFVMRITSPFPAAAEKPYLEVTGISCSDKMGGLKFKPGTTSKEITPTEGRPVAVFYTGPDGGSQVKCVPSDSSKWEATDYTVSASVDYKVEATAFLTTAFIRADQDEALRKQGIDPAVVNKIPPATAKYDNVPVTLTWGPPDLTKSPASISLKPYVPDLEVPEVAALQAAKAATPNMLITIYVSKNSGWESSEIKAVNSLTLTAPAGVELVGDSCDFELPPKGKVGGGEGGVTVYKVKEDKIKKVVDDSKKMQASPTGYAIAMPRFIGDAIRFECGMKVSSEALSGSDWAPARFDVSGSFIFTTKLDSITFTVTGEEKTAAPVAQAAQPTQQQLQDKCKATGGTWKSAANPPACDCGSGKKWDSYPGGCVPASPSQPPASPSSSLPIAEP